MSDAEVRTDEVRSEVYVQKGEAPQRAGATRASQAQEPARSGRASSRAQMREWRDAFQRRLPPWWSRAAGRGADRHRDHPAVLLHPDQRLPERDDHLARLRGDGARAEHRRRLRRPARPRLRRVLRARRVLAWAGSARGSSSRPTSTSAPRTSQSTLPGIHLNFLLIVVCAVADRGAGRDHHRAADAAAAQRLHRDRDARVRRDHPRVRRQRPEHPPRRRSDADRRQPRHPGRRPAVLPGASARSTCSSSDPGTG